LRTTPKFVLILPFYQQLRIPSSLFRLGLPSKIFHEFHSAPINLSLSFVGALAKLRKATINFVSPVRMKHRGSHYTDIHKI